MKMDPTSRDLLRSLSDFADMNLTASWGWVRAPMPTPRRNVVTTVIHSLDPKLEKLVHPLNPSSVPVEDPSESQTWEKFVSQRSTRALLPAVTPPK